MGDLTNPKLIYAKGLLFLLLGFIALAWILVETQSWRVGLLLAICIWGFCRFYYFAFYVIEHYVDDGFHYAGLWDFFQRRCLTKPGPEHRPRRTESKN